MMHTRKREIAKGAGRMRSIKVPGKGVEIRPGKPRIVVEFDDELFAAIRTRAVAMNVSFCEAVRTLCQWGLDEDEDMALSSDLRRA